MKTIIEICANNNHPGMTETITSLKLLPDCEVYEYGCLTACGVCYMIPYALVDGKMLEAENAAALYEAIRHIINQKRTDHT